MSNPTAETHVYIGVFRPPWDEVKQLERQIVTNGCRCGCSFACPYVIQFDKLHEHYDRGCFDEPVYKTHEEMMRVIARELQEKR